MKCASLKYSSLSNPHYWRTLCQFKLQKLKQKIEMDFDMPEATNEEEEILKRHRLERKDLQAKIQALKKTAPKGKKKKEIQEDIVKMEQELETKQNAELEAYSGLNNVNPVDQEVTCIVEDDDKDVEIEEQNNEEFDAAMPVKTTRAQRRRNKKAEESKEREKRIAEQEEKNREGPRVLEMKKIKEILNNLGLELHSIPADGNCLYCAVSHQLKVTGREATTVKSLRKETASFMKEHKDEFLPFMYNDSDEPVDEDQFLEYCKNVENTKLWGSQLELRALSNILKCPIKIIQAAGQPTVQGENFTGPQLVLTYHRHLYRLGEHYNSTIDGTENGE